MQSDGGANAVGDDGGLSLAACALLLVHLMHHLAQRVHDVEAAIGEHELSGLLGLPGAIQVDGLGELLQLGLREVVQLEDVLPFAGIVAGELLQDFDVRLDLGGGEVVRGEIFGVAGVEKATLSVLGVFEQGLHLTELEQNLMGVGDQVLIGDLYGELPPDDGEVRDQDEKQQEEAGDDSCAFVQHPLHGNPWLRCDASEADGAAGEDSCCQIMERCGRLWSRPSAALRMIQVG